MRPSIRLAALMGLPVIYVFTHDSIFVGEDGPTHQPIEHVAALRTIPNLTVLRPADEQETAWAWRAAMERLSGPTALILTRQNLVNFAKPSTWTADAAKGAYVAYDCEGTPDVVIAATGSEVNLALEAAGAPEFGGKAPAGKKVRVVSVTSVERLKEQDAGYLNALFPDGARVVTAEVGVSMGLQLLASSRSDVFSLDRFGESGPAAAVAEHLGYTADRLRAMIEV
jgi:transketolase